MEEVLVAIIGLLLVISTWERRQLVKALQEQDVAFLSHIAELEAEHLKERRELANRIQRPEMVPVAGQRARHRPPKDAAAMGAIGTVQPPRADAD